MKWKLDADIYVLEFNTDDLYKLKTGGVYTIRTKEQALIIVKKEEITCPNTRF